MEKKHEVVKEYIMNIILSSPLGTKIPSERDLVRHFNFSRPTIQKAIEDLLMEGYLYKVNRRGTFTSASRHCTHLNRMISFSEAAREIQVTPKTQVLDRSLLLANDFLASKISCKAGERVHYFLRLRKHGDTPVSLDYSYFADFAVSGITRSDLERSIYRYIEQVRGLQICSSDILIEAVQPEPEVASSLEIPMTEPLLQLERFSRLKDGRVFEYTISFTVSRYNKLAVSSLR